jgi:hypothetical protein
MLMIWFNKPHDLTTFTPAWAFLVCLPDINSEADVSHSVDILDISYGKDGLP